MSPPVRTLLVAFAGVALLVPAMSAAVPQGDPPEPPGETSPLPPEPEPPVDPVEAPPEPEPTVTITIEVPPLPDPTVAAPKQKPPPRAPARRAAPERVERVAERETRSQADVAPVAEQEPAPKAKPKPRQPQRRVTAPVSAPQDPIRERKPAHGVLSVQFSTTDDAAPGAMRRLVLYLAFVLAALLAALLSLVGAAPVFAPRWPHVFVPVIRASERLVLAGVCLATGALTLAITWALTGPGA